MFLRSFTAFCYGIGIAQVLGGGGGVHKDNHSHLMGNDACLPDERLLGKFHWQGKRNVSTFKSYFFLNNHFGRTGNNFLQIKNALTFAMCCGAVLEVVQHALFPKMQTQFNFSGIKSTSLVQGSETVLGCEGHFIGGKHFFYTANIPIKLNTCTIDFVPVLKWALMNNTLPHGCRSNDGPKCPEAFDNDETLVVHIRSGDIFGDNPHHSYRQPPVAFYLKIFEQRQWTKIILITSLEEESLLNPVWKYFRNATTRSKHHFLANISFVFQSSENFGLDLGQLLCARNLVPAFGTMGMIVEWVAPFLKHVYTFERCNQQKIPTASCTSFTMEGYEMGHGYKWTGSPAQRDEMINFSINDISISSGF